MHYGLQQALDCARRSYQRENGPPSRLFGRRSRPPPAIDLPDRREPLLQCEQLAFRLTMSESLRAENPPNFINYRKS